MTIIPNRRPKPTVSIVPLIDIMVMILIFFIITMVPRENRDVVRLILAQSGQSQQVEKTGSQVILSLDETGKRYLNGTEFSEEKAFTAELKKLYQQNPNSFELILDFDKQAQNQWMISLMDQVIQAGIPLEQVAGMEVTPIE